MKVRAVQIGLGPLGQRIAADLEERGLGHVVGALDVDPEFLGKPLNEVVPGCAAETPVRSVPGEIADWERVDVAIVTTSSDLELCMETYRELVKRKCPVISTCEELSWPWLRHPILAQELHELCVRHRVSVLGTGVNPGFLMDLLPVITTTVCGRVDSIRVRRVQDAAKRRLPFQRKIGAGLSPDDFRAREAKGTLRHVGLGESLHFVAHYLGLGLDRWEETLEPVLAEAETPSGLGPVPKGHARGVRQVATGWRGSEPAIELVFQAAVGEPNEEDRVVIQGDPPIDLCIQGGVHGDVATSAVVLNAIRPLLRCEPGLQTMATLPLQGCTPPNGSRP